jgi:DNA repair exonuclease SbcCD ATPase subunit
MTAPHRALLGSLALAAAALAPAAASAQGRERAAEQIPELMGRILESQEEIREREGEYAPLVQRYTEKLVAARAAIGEAESDEAAAEALTDDVETYAARLEAQDEGLEAIRSAVVRMRADARELARVAERTGETAAGADAPDERLPFYEDQFQGVAAGTAALAEKLGRESEVAITGSVLQAAWAVHGSQGIAIPELGRDGAVAFARRVEGLYAQYQARANQLEAERRAVRRLLDLLVERQLGQRLDALFAGNDSVGLGSLLSAEGKSEDWNDLGSVVSRVVGMPSHDGDGDGRDDAYDRLDYFARGTHRERSGSETR